MVTACATSSDTSCRGVNILVLLAVPMLLGFSERALTSFEGVFGEWSGRTAGIRARKARPQYPNSPEIPNGDA